MKIMVSEVRCKSDSSACRRFCTGIYSRMQYGGRENKENKEMQNMNASNKTKMKYKVVNGRNPRTGAPLKRPVLTDRETYRLEQVVNYAINAGYVRGHLHDMCGLLNGMIEAIQQLGKNGKIVNLNDWLRIHGELTGTVDDSHQLSSENEYHVVITALKELKCDLNSFAWVNVDNWEHRAKVEHLMYVGSPTDGQIAKTKQIIATGKNLQFLPGDSVTLSWSEGEGESAETKTEAIVPVESDFSHMLFEWPTALDDVPAGTEITFTFLFRGGSEDGQVQMSSQTAVTVDIS